MTRCDAARLHLATASPLISCQLFATGPTSGNLVTISIHRLICVSMPLHLHQHAAQFSMRSSRFVWCPH